VARARHARRFERPDPSPIGAFLVTLVTLATLLYSVYGQQPSIELNVGDESTQTFIATGNATVLDPAATERRRQVARAQVPMITSIDDEARALVLSSITASNLPPDTTAWIVGRYEQARGVLASEVPSVIDEAVARTPSDRQREVRLVLEQRLMATALPDPILTQVARDAAAAAVEPVLRIIEQGDVIVAEGDVINEQHLQALEQLGFYDPTTRRVRQVATIAFGVLLAAGLLALPAWYGAWNLRHLVTRRQYAFLLGLTLLTLALQRVMLDVNTDVTFVLLVPLVVATLIGETAGLLWAAWLAIAVALLAPTAPLTATIATLTTGVAAARLASNAKTRLSLIIAGTIAGTAGGVVLIALQAAGGAITPLPSALTLGAYALGGALAGIVALGLLPLAEGVFEFLTDFRLTELASPQSPLLQRLVLQAPGTYQHSQIIANLVEQSVVQIGGNALLARVGALYHDVGKLRRPQFFSENQVSGENPHDKVSPHLSFLIITNHVRDGVELLREHGLPPALEPFVTEHHGTTVLAYFYKRALEDTEKLSELNFRYPGPKPRTKETAVLMLADAVESASRSLSDPSQGAIRALIERLFEQRLQDDQLSESPLTLRDLDVVASTFERVLTASMHRRVRYPTAEEIKGLQRGGDPRRDVALPSA